jgi:hypothetical protein
MVIYWWTGTPKDSERQYMIDYKGGVYPRSRQSGQDDFAFRAVRDVPQSDNRT